MNVPLPCSVNTIFAGGSMGQFSSMTVAERMALCREWVKQGHIQGLYVICHCGGTIQSDSIALAGDAKSAGADAIGMLPPYYESYGNWVSFFCLAHGCCPVRHVHFRSASIHLFLRCLCWV